MAKRDWTLENLYIAFQFGPSVSLIIFIKAPLSDNNCSCTPKMAYEALDSLIATLKRILKQVHHPHIYHQITSIHDEAVFLQLNLASNLESMKQRIWKAANTTEEIIEYLFSEENPSYGGSMKLTVEQLRQAAQKFRLSTAADEVDSIDRKRRLGDISPSIRSSSRTATRCKDVVVGFDEDLEEIKNWLTSYHPSQLQVLSIVGMGGSGKTTLAKLVYNDELIVKPFDICAWVTISQDYSVGSILSNLLGLLSVGNADVRRHVVYGDIHELKSKETLIRRILELQRFLIVIDDMCSKKAWDDIKMLFPRTPFASRIILTTRLHDVAAYVDSSCSNIHMMRLLDEKHSWSLLKQKVFANEPCPFELEDVGNTIANNCGGLPLSIVVVAGILSKVGKDRCLWEQIASHAGNLETLMALSYNHLPDDSVRSCFLYMGGFPEDYKIHVSELIKLWIGEGFIVRSCQTRSKSLKEEAEDCLENLVERSLVLVTSRKVDGKIKICSMHDMVRDFCIRQAGREKFLVSVVDYLPSPILRKHFLPRLLKNYDRISVSSHDLDLKDSMHASSTHSIICIPKRGYKSVDCVHKFSSLEVFHVLRRNDHPCWHPGDKVFDLNHLTYLASSFPDGGVPPAISKLRNLQTLIVYGHCEVRLPVAIWSLRQLKHLIGSSFLPLPHPATTSPLENLETVSMVKDLVCSRDIMEMIPNTKKLGIRLDFQEWTLGEGGMYERRVNKGQNESFYSHLHNVGILCQLEELKLEIHEIISGRQRNPVFPPSLKKLTLCGEGIRFTEMINTCYLPNLQVLKLRKRACSGERWKTIGGKFGELRLVLIEGSDIQAWETEITHFPKLECLILYKCANLSEIPSEIGDIPTLKLIEVDMHLWESAKKIQQRRSGRNEGFQVRRRTNQ